MDEFGNVLPRIKSEAAEESKAEEKAKAKDQESILPFLVDKKKPSKEKAKAEEAKRLAAEKAAAEEAAAKKAGAPAKPKYMSGDMVVKKNSS